MSRRYTHVFVDAVDTLIRVRGSVGAIYEPVAERHGATASAAAIDAAFATAIAAAPPPFFPAAVPEDIARLERDWWHDVVRRTFEPLGGVPHFESFFIEVFELFRSPQVWELMPGARAALTELRAEGRRLGILSDMDGRLFDVLEALELRTLFDPIVLSSRAGRSKRDGALFPVALALAGAAAETTLHIGDSLTADVAGARAAGMTAIWFDAAARQPAPPGVAVVRGWAEIPARIRALERGET